MKTELAENIHGTALLVGQTGILIRGPARSGKSSLCVCLLRRATSLGLEAALVADDRVDLEWVDGTVLMSPPAILKGWIEIAGVGIVRERAVDRVRLALIVDLVEPERIERMPAREAMTASIQSIEIRRITLPVKDAAFAADVVLSLLNSDKLETF